MEFLIRMRTWIGVCGLVLGLTSTAAAGMIGSPIATLKQKQIRPGLQGGLLNQDLSLETNHIPDIEIVQTALNVEYGVLDAVEVFVRLGMVDDDFRVLNIGNIPPPTVFSDPPQTEVKFLAETALSYGLGVKVTLYEFSRFLLGTGMQFERFVLKSPDSTISTDPPSDARLTWNELKIFAGGHLKDVPYFVPYGGFYLNLLRGKLDLNPPVAGVPSGVDVKQDDLIGIFYGADVPITPVKGLLFGVELRFLAENGFSFSLSYLF